MIALKIQKYCEKKKEKIQTDHPIFLHNCNQFMSGVNHDFLRNTLYQQEGINVTGVCLRESLIWLLSIQIACTILFMRKAPLL